MIAQSYPLWTIIAVLGLGTFAIRYSFLGMLGGRALPEWLLRHLRYTPVAVMPGLIAPMLLWPDATGGVTDPARLAAAGAALAVGLWRRNMLAIFAAGMGTLYAVQWLTG